MCGISGFFSEPTLDPGEAGPRLARMGAALAHRGPDGRGTALFPHAALAHNRLAIIDLVGGRQPLTGASGQTHVVFNGEIYNYRELRGGLRDYPFRTQSDTEVILALYEREGVAGWSRLRGMYAFALWDDGAGRGFLLRDPLGIKPLFFNEQAGRLAFASEAKALFAHGIRPELDAGALHQVMNFRYLAGAGSLFRGIGQLPPGGLLTWAEGRTRLVSGPGAGPEGGDGDGSLGEIFEAAVSRHLVSDVPVGCFLSGGIDSALVARAASQHGALSSYTLEVGDDPQEAEHAAQTAAWLGIANHRQAFALPDPVAVHRDLLRHLETPKVNALQGMMLAEFTARHVKVALSGLGGDELFYGYNAHRLMWLAAAGRLAPGSIRRAAAALLRPLGGNMDWSERTRALAMLRAVPDWSRVYGLLRNVWDSPGMRRRVYGERLLDMNPPDSFAWLAACFPAGADPVEAMAAFEMDNKLVNDLLWNEDRVSMRVGLESRVPFLDHELVRHARSRSRRELMPWGRGKYALKRYARRVLPPRILARRKSGFQLNIVAAAGNELKPVFDEYLSEERLRAHGLFNAAFVRQVRAMPAAKGARWHWFLLYLMAQTHMLVEEFDVA